MHPRHYSAECAGLLPTPWEVFHGTVCTQPVYARGTYCVKVTAVSGTSKAIVDIGMVGLHGLG